ncbi:hypothetical protein ABPG72_007357 [Tetrahymena utriculariae]
MKKIIIISLLIYLIVQINAQQDNNCIVGCSNCQLTGNQQICSQCEQGFTLYNNQCLYHNCPSNYSLQRYITKQEGQSQVIDTCKAICDSSYIENNTYNLCQQTQQCPLSFVGSSNNSLGTIESIYQVNEQITMIVYPTYIKLINSQTGQQLQDLSSPNTLTTLYFKNYLITFSTTNLVSEWIFETNFFRNIQQIQKGQLTKKSQFIDLGVNQQAITSYDDSLSLVYFSRIYLEEQPLRLDTSILSFSYVDCSLKIVSQLIFCFGRNQKLIAKQLSIQSDFLNFLDVKQTDLCQNYAFTSNPIIQTLVINQVSASQYLIIQQQSTQLMQIIYDKVGAIIDCKLNDLKEFPLQLRLIDQKESQLLFAVNYLTKLTLMDQNIQEILNIPFQQNQFTDLAFFQYQNTNPMTNYKLITIQASSPNIITYAINLINKSYSQLNAYPAIITNPLKFASYGDKMIQSDQLKPFTNADQLFIVNNNLQSVSAATDQVNYIVMPYQKKIIGHRDKVNKMVYSENTQYLLTCSNDGSIIAWYTLISLNPLQIYKITQSGQKCRDILIYQDTWVVALFSRLIHIFQINNAFVSDSYQFQNPVSDTIQFIAQFSSSILLYYDKQFTLLNGVDLKQASLGQYLDSQIISIVALQNYNLIVQNGSNQLQMYQFDPRQNYQFNKVQSQNYQSIYGDFSIIKIDNIQQNSFEVLLGCKKGAFVILDSKLAQIFYQPISQGFPTNIQKYQDNDTYILFCQSTEQNQIYLFFHYAIIRSQNKGYLYSRSYSLKFNVGLYPDKDFDGNTNISYMFLMPFSFFTLILKGTYRPLDQSVDYGYFVYLIGNTVTSFASKDDNNIQYYGSQSGLLSFDNSNQNSFSTFNLNSNINSGTIKSIKTSPFFESIFVIHNDVDVHNIYSQQYNYTIKFASQYSTNRVIDLVLSEKNYILLAFKSQQIIIKNFQTNALFSFDQMSQINGAIIDEVNLRVFVYGSTLRVFNFNLTSQSIITAENLYNYQQCILTLDLIICKVNSNILSIINKKTYTIIANTKVTGLQDKFQVYVDEFNKQIFLTDTIIQVFDFTGNVVGQITSINLSILNLQIFGKNIAVLTSTFIFIFQRQYLTLIVYFKPTGGGNLLGYYYISDYNTLVYYADEIRYGQIFYFNLSTYQDDGFSISAYSELGIGRVVSLFYDSINYRLNYIDSVGVFYSINFVSQRSFYNIINVYDFKVVGPPVGMTVDQAFNNLFIFNQNIIVQLNYNLVQKFQIIQYYKVEQFYFKYQKQDLSQKSSTTYYIFDQSNVLYSYKDFSQTFLTYFSNPIRNVFQMDIYQIILFIFDDQILIYTYDQVENNQIFSTNYVAQIKNPKARIFLTNELLLTTEKQLIHINYSFYKDGTNNWKKKIIDYNQNNEYMRNHIVFGSPTQQKIFFSFSSGRVIYYDQSTTISQQIMTPWQPQGNIINNFVKLFFKTNSYLILAYRYNIITLINLSDLQVIQQLDTTTLNSKQSNQINSIFADETYGQCFISFMFEKLIYVLDLKSFSFLQYLSFPNNQYNRFATTDKYILVYTNSQINLFQRGTLKYINQIKKINSSIQITTLNIINQNIIIICMNTQLEIYLINSDKSVTQIDSTPISNSEIIDAYLQQNDSNTMRIVGISDNGIFDKIINTQLYIQSTQTSVITSQPAQYSCYSSLSMVDRIQGQNIFQYLYNNNILKMQYRIIVNQGNILKSLNFINHQSIQVILAPDSSNQNNTLNLKYNSFQQLQRTNIYFSNFSFIFTQNNQIYTFSNITQQVTWQNVFIQAQNFTGVQILFNNVTNVTISNLIIQNIQYNLELQNKTDSIRNSTLFQFTDCVNVFISNLTVINSKILSDSLLIGFERVQNIYINNFLIFQNEFHQLFSFNKGQELHIQQITINGNQISNRIPYQNDIPQTYDQALKTQEQYLFTIVGFYNTKISQVAMISNRNVLFLFYVNSYSSDTEQVILYEDQITISDSEFSQTNISKNNQLLLSKQVNQPIFNIQATTLNLVGVNYKLNQGNIFIQNSKTVNIQNSIFESNISIDGGAFIFSTISEQINIINTQFRKNSALGSGGAIYLYQTNNLVLDEKSIIESNIAQIGGGIRIVLTTGDPFQVINYQDGIINNVGIIFGKNIGIYPVRAILDTRSINQRNLHTKIRNEQNQIAKSFQNNDQQNLNSNRNLKNEDNLSIISFNSGDYLHLQVQLVDQYDQIVNFQVSQISQEQYAQSVQQELKSYQIQIFADNSINTQVSGQTLLNFNQFQESRQAFAFSSLKVSAQPKSNRILKLVLTTNSFSQSRINQNITINFRQCNQGEIFKDFTSTITTCEICQSGFYSLADPNKPYNTQNLSCLQCPSQASQCQGNQIVLKDGYWRQSNKTDAIFSCNQIIQTQTCKESDQTSKEGCIEGFSGPFCQFCDESGKLWQNRYTFNVSDQLCYPCDEKYVYISFIIFLSFLLLFYLVANIFMFMNNYIYHSTCTYLRQLQIIPIFVSCMKDKSTQYIKTLINYLQITSVLFQLNMKSNFTTLVDSTSYLGSPATNILSNSHCVYPSYFVEKYGTVKIKLLFTSIYPLFFIILILVGLFLCKKLKLFGIQRYHKYAALTILYTFFQPSLVKYFTLAISCRYIGDNSYVSLNFQIQCNDESYRSFINYLIVPYLIILFIAPIYIIFLLYKYKKKLNYCTTKYRLGYFYLDYKPNYYFWEINKIYGKTFVIAFYTWYNQVNQSFSYQVVSLFICFTIISNSIFKPFVVKQIEILDSLSRVLILINIILQQLSQIYPYSIFTIIQYTMHILFVFGVLLIILRLKLSKMIDQKDGFLFKLLKKWVHKNLINLFFYKNTNQMHVYKNWKKIFKNITHLIQNQAQKVQQQCETNTNKVMASRQNKTLFTTQNVKCLHQDSSLVPQQGQFGSLQRTFQDNTSIFTSQILSKCQSQIQTPGIVKNCTIFKQCSEADQVTDNRYQDEILEQTNINSKIQNIVESINDLDNIQQYEENTNQQANNVKNIDNLKTIIKLNKN